MSDLFFNQIEDLYDAELRLAEALRNMAEAAHSNQLKQAFGAQLTETGGHIRRLEQIFREINRHPTRETSKAMKGLILEGEDMIKAHGYPDIKDTAIIAAAQRVQHYQISGYGTARSFAQRLGLTQAANLLQQTLDEEKADDEKLTNIAESSVNVKASGTATGSARSNASSR